MGLDSRFARQAKSLANQRSAADARQHDSEFGEFPRLGFDLDSAAVLLDNDVVAHRETKPGAFTGWLGREKRIENLFSQFGWYAGAIVANTNFNRTAYIFGGGTQHRPEIGLAYFFAARGCSIEAVGDNVQQGAGNFLREQLD